MADITVSRRILATPEAVWAVVSDLPRMGELSPENRGGTWLKGATGPALGAKFKGSNANGSKSWSTTVTVSECDPGRTFGFEVTIGPIKVAHWRYDIADAGNGASIVTETWSDRRSPIARKLAARATGVNDRADHNRSGMEETLRRLEEKLAQPGV